LLTFSVVGNTQAKYYENPTMLSRVRAKNVGDVYLRHSVDSITTFFTTNGMVLIATTEM